MYRKKYIYLSEDDSFGQIKGQGKIPEKELKIFR